MKRTLKSLRGKRFRATRIAVGMMTIEDIPAMREQLEKSCKERGLTLTENEDSFIMHNNTGQQMTSRKPKIKKQATGILEFRSQDYRFQDEERKTWSYGGDLRADMLTDFGFEYNLRQGKFEYHLEEL